MLINLHLDLIVLDIRLIIYIRSIQSIYLVLLYALYLMLYRRDSGSSPLWKLISMLLDVPIKQLVYPLEKDLLNVDR